MRRFWIIALVFTVGSSFAQGQYFPKSSLGLTPAEEQFKQTWYSEELRALQEPSLLALTKSPTSEGYRFLWLRTFHHPIAIRLEPHPDGTSTLTTKVASGAAGFHPGVLSESSSIVLTREQTQTFLSKLDELNFWSAPNPVDDQKGTDGSQWIIEGVKNGHYHVVDRWLPDKGIVRELGMMLAFDLAKMKIPEKELY